MIQAFSVKGKSRELIDLLDKTTLEQLEYNPVVELSGICGSLLKGNHVPSVALAIRHADGKNKFLETLKKDVDAHLQSIPIEISFRQHSLVVVPMTTYVRLSHDERFTEQLENLLLHPKDRTAKLTPHALPLPEVNTYLFQPSRHTPYHKNRPVRQHTDDSGNQIISAEKEEAINNIIDIFEDKGLLHSHPHLPHVTGRILGSDTVKLHQINVLERAIGKWAKSGLDHLSSEETNLLKIFAEKLTDNSLPDFFDIIPKVRRGRPPKAAQPDQVLAAAPLSPPIPAKDLKPIQLRNFEGGYLLSVSSNAKSYISIARMSAGDGYIEIRNPPGVDGCWHAKISKDAAKELQRELQSGDDDFKSMFSDLTENNRTSARLTGGRDTKHRT